MLSYYNSNIYKYILCDTLLKPLRLLFLRGEFCKIIKKIHVKSLWDSVAPFNLALNWPIPNHFDGYGFTPYSYAPLLKKKM